MANDVSGLPVKTGDIISFTDPETQDELYGVVVVPGALLTVNVANCSLDGGAKLYYGIRVETTLQIVSGITKTKGEK